MPDFVTGLVVLAVFVLSWPPMVPFILCCIRREQIPEKGDQLHEGYTDTMSVGG